MRHVDCRYFKGDRDYCVALRVLAPRDVCKGCKHYEPNGKGLGDYVEKAIGVATLGQAKRVTKRVKPGGCGCAKRRAALNRLGERITDTLKGS